MTNSAARANDNGDGLDTLLIVDDTPTNIQILLSYLQNSGYKVLIATDGEQALTRAERGAPDLILLDVMMPGIDGFETCRRLKTDPALQNIPVIFMTALDETENKVKGFQAGGVDYVTKPLAQEEVLVRVRTHLALRKLQQAQAEQNLRLRTTSALLQAMADALTDYLQTGRLDDACALLLGCALRQTGSRRGALGLLPAGGQTDVRLLALVDGGTDRRRDRPPADLGLGSAVDLAAGQTLHLDDPGGLLGEAGGQLLALPLPLTENQPSEPVRGFLAVAGGRYRLEQRQMLERLARAAAAIIECELARRRQASERHRRRRAEDETLYLREEINTHHNVGHVIGNSPALKKVLAQVAQVAPTDSSVIIHGETGSGKELIARAVHELSDRRQRPLITVNCAALPETLVESELFGHEKGAFTGATEQRRGRFELADGGTLFLDEIGDMPLDAQVKLLRVLQEQRFERIGGSQTLTVDVRVLAASHRDLEQLVSQGAFRQDLFYRLNVFPIELPPLRERREDIAPLAEHFGARSAAKFGRRFHGLSAAARERLLAYGWPGNVRELQNIVERAVILAGDGPLEVPPELLKTAVAPPPDDRPEESALWRDRPTLDELQRRYIEQVLRDCAWTIEGDQGAAAVLGVKPSTLRGRMQKLGVSKPAGPA